MIGRVYRWRDALWMVMVRARPTGPRNVLIHRVTAGDPENHHASCVDGDYWIRTGEIVVRPFRGLRRR